MSIHELSDTRIYQSKLKYIFKRPPLDSHVTINKHNVACDCVCWLFKQSRKSFYTSFYV